MWNSFIERICEIWRSGTMRRKYFCSLFIYLMFSFAYLSIHCVRWLFSSLISALFFFFCAILFINDVLVVSAYTVPLLPSPYLPFSLLTIATFLAVVVLLPIVIAASCSDIFMQFTFVLISHFHCKTYVRDACAF